MTEGRRRAANFYIRMAYLSAAIAFIGFTPTYWGPIAAGAGGAPPVVHLHGLLFSAWTTFFIVQARLAAGASLRTHRVLGMAGIALATAMLFAGVMVAVHAMRAGIAGGFEQRAREFTIVPVTIVLFFAGAVAAAIAWGREPQALGARPAPLPSATMRRRLLDLLEDWQGLLRGNVPEPQHALRRLVRGRLTMHPCGS